MKKIITGMALLLVTTLSAFSQTKNITVSGRVVEDTKEPAIQATVQLLLLPDSVQASGTATTAQGYFTLPKVSAGKYVLKVSYIGFKSQYIPLHLYATTTAKNVGTLTLETDAVCWPRLWLRQKRRKCRWWKIHWYILHLPIVPPREPCSRSW